MVWLVQRERDQYLKRSETVNKEREEERRHLLHTKEQVRPLLGYLWPGDWVSL
jgi:hypothetical protein